MTVKSALIKAFRKTPAPALLDLVAEMDSAYISGGSGVDVEDEGTPVATATTINFTGAGVDATDAGGGVVDVDIPGGGSGSAGTIQFSKPTNGVTRATNTLGSLSTPWTDTVTTTSELPEVRYRVDVSAQAGTNSVITAALAREGTIIDRAIEYNGAQDIETRITFSGVDEPGSPGDYDYEVYVAIGSGTVFVSSVVDTSTSLTTNKDGVSSMELQAVLTE